MNDMSYRHIKLYETREYKLCLYIHYNKIIQYMVADMCNGRFIHLVPIEKKPVIMMLTVLPMPVCILFISAFIFQCKQRKKMFLLDSRFHWSQLNQV